MYENIQKKDGLIKNVFSYNVNFLDGPYIEIGDNEPNSNYRTSFIKNGFDYYSCEMKNHTWGRANLKYYIDWNIKIYKEGKLTLNYKKDKLFADCEKDELILDYKIDLKDKKVHIVIDSNSLGDTLAWVPCVEEFRLKHQCEVYCRTAFNYLFEKSYPDINFISDTDLLPQFFAKYIIGYYLGENKFDYIPKDPKTLSLQDVACNILGLESKEVSCKLALPAKNSEEKTVCIATHSTSQCKYWNNKEGWEKTVDYLKEIGYKVICIDKNPVFGIDSHMNYIPRNCIDKTGNFDLKDRIQDLVNCDFFIGLGSGLSWLAWACKKPVIMISGFSKPFAEFRNEYRVHNDNVCNGCWNDISAKFDASNWLWCPRDKDFECSKEITFEMVKEKIDKCISENNFNFLQNKVLDFDAIKISHILSKPNDERESKSVKDLIKLAASSENFFYYQDLNKPYEDEPPKENVIFGNSDWVVGKTKPLGSWGLTSGHYGCYLAHINNLKNFFYNSSQEFLLLCECDCKLNYDIDFVKDKLNLACSFLKNSNYKMFSLVHPNFESAFIDDLGNDIHSVDSIIKSHMILIHKKDKNFYERIINSYGWHAIDLWYNVVFQKENEKILCFKTLNLTSQYDGPSQVDRAN